MTTQEVLTWEERWSRPAALCAFLAAAMILAQVVLVQSAIEDRPGIEALPDFYLSVEDNSTPFLASGIAQGLGGLALMGVFLYLFRTTMHRGSPMPQWFIYIVVIGPLLYALAAVTGILDQIDKADQFTSQEVRRGERGDDVATDIRNEVDGLTIAFSYAGTIATAFLFVMLPLRARRVGLLSPFMGILGVICGALLVLPLLPPIIQVFWLVALGAIFLGLWPGGRGPAWESGEAEPWPSAAERRGLVAPKDEPGESLLDPSEPDGADAPPPEEPVRQSSRKRKRKR